MQEGSNGTWCAKSLPLMPASPRASVGVPGVLLHISSLLTGLGKQWKVNQVLAPLSHTGDYMELQVLDFHLVQPWRSQVFGSELTDARSFFRSLFL